jgi:mitochondrial fission protein ELM1
MVYEAMTAGARVGLLEVPRRRSDRVTRAIDGLANDDRITRYRDFVRGADLPGPRPLAEADRIAAEILRRWFPARLRKADTA